MLSKTMRRARTAVTIGCILLAGCQSAISRGVEARHRNKEINLSFTIENNLLRLDTVTLDNRAVWVMTANNAPMSADNARRSVRIRLNANMERPEEVGPVLARYLER